MKWTIASRLGIAFAVLLLISAASSIILHLQVWELHL